jgi:hypothetical protein
VFSQNTLIAEETMGYRKNDGAAAEEKGFR